MRLFGSVVLLLQLVIGVGGEHDNGWHSSAVPQRTQRSTFMQHGIKFYRTAKYKWIMHHDESEDVLYACLLRSLTLNPAAHSTL